MHGNFSGEHRSASLVFSQKCIDCPRHAAILLETLLSGLDGFDDRRVDFHFMQGEYAIDGAQLSIQLLNFFSGIAANCFSSRSICPLSLARLSINHAIEGGVRTRPV